jgi:two-component system, sensor histidine kinase LadS
MSVKVSTIDSEKSMQECFPDENSCLEFLAEFKWKHGFTCRKCGHENYCKGKRPFSRRCTRCKTEESATAHTIFHRCKIPLSEAFRLAQVVCVNPAISSYEISRLFEIRQMTCWKFKTRILECLTDAEKSKAIKAMISGESYSPENKSLNLST